MREQGSWERQQLPWNWRRKGGLETPLQGRVIGERKVTFAPPIWYDGLVFLCIFGAPLAYFLGRSGVPVPIFSAPVSGFWVSIAVCVAGLWAALSNERMACDLRARTYARLEGQSLRKRITRGSLSELDALVLTAEEYLPGALGHVVIYRLVLHWKGSKEPLLVVERESASIPTGAQLNYGAGRILQRGARYAKMLGVPFYDNSYFHSGSPVPVV